MILTGTLGENGMKADLYEKFPNSDGRMFLQWKGSEVCIDFQCKCGGHWHFDGWFASPATCPLCYRKYDLGTQVKMVCINDDKLGEQLFKLHV